MYFALKRQQFADVPNATPTLNIDYWNRKHTGKIPSVITPNQLTQACGIHIYKVPSRYSDIY